MTTSNVPDTTYTKPASAPMSNVPDLLRVGTIPDNTEIEVETDILDSVVFNQSFCRFQLQNKGILHSNSKISISASLTSASSSRAFYPAGVGVHSLIERAVLKAGTKTICEVALLRIMLSSTHIRVCLFLENIIKRENNTLLVV